MIPVLTLAFLLRNAEILHFNLDNIFFLSSSQVTQRGLFKKKPMSHSLWTTFTFIMIQLIAEQDWNVARFRLLCLSAV